MFRISAIIREITILLFLLSAVVFLTFVIGNFQEFLDSTQLILLNIFEILSGMFILLGMYHIIVTITLMIKYKSHYFVRLGIIVAGEIIVIFLFLLANIINTITKTVI